MPFCHDFHMKFILFLILIFLSGINSIFPCSIQTICYASQNLELVLQDDKGKTLLAIPVKDGAEFAIRYIHSVAKTPVTDYFLVKNDGIYLDRTVYKDFGAGLPHNPEPGQTMRTENGQIIISGYDRKLPAFQVRVGRIAHHTLLLQNNNINANFEFPQEIALDNLAPQGSAITFTTIAAD